MSVAELESDMQELLILKEKATRANVKTYIDDVLANVAESALSTAPAYDFASDTPLYVPLPQADAASQTLVRGGEGRWTSTPRFFGAVYSEVGICSLRWPFPVGVKAHYAFLVRGVVAPKAHFVNSFCALCFLVYRATCYVLVVQQLYSVSDCSYVKEKKEREERMQPQPINAVPQPDKPENAVKHWETITQYSVELGRAPDRFIVVDFRFKGIDTLPRENVTCVFTERSFDLKIVGYEGKNYRFLANNLYDDINPQISAYRVNKNHVIVDMCKKSLSGGLWLNLQASKARASMDDDTIDAKERDKNTIKQMYEDGNDEVKKLITERINQARSTALDNFGA